jgi:hypothetical protein
VLSVRNCSLSADSSKEKKIPNVDFEDPMDFGMGDNSLQLLARGTGVTGSAPDSVSGGQAVQFSLNEAYEDFQRAFDFSADASASYGLFHASAKFRYAENHKFKSFSRYLVASVIVTNAFRQLHNVQLTDSAHTLLANGQTDRFHEELGDTFVLGITTGGAYYAVLEFTCESEQDQKSISAQLDVGEYGLFDAEAKFSSRMQDFKGHTSLTVDSFQQGGADTRQSVNVDDIIAKATNFPLDVKQVAVPFSAFLQDYKTLDLPAGPNPTDVENARLVLQNYLALRNQLVQKLNEIEYIQQFPDRFVNPEQFDLAGMHSQVAQLLNQVTRGASACVNKIMDCQFPEISIPTFSLPPLKPGVQIQVPNVTGISRDDAQTILQRLGLQPQITFHIFVHFRLQYFQSHGHNPPAGLVFHQTPDAGTMVAPDSLVELYWADPNS